MKNFALEIGLNGKSVEEQFNEFFKNAAATLSIFGKLLLENGLSFEFSR
jgi:hypothetical protein